MIDDIVRALDERAWPEYVHRQLGSRIGAAVGPALRPVIGAVVAEPGPVPGSGPVLLGGSKLGGLPHVDGAFDWPTEDGTDEPLALVCQVAHGSAPCDVVRLLGRPHPFRDEPREPGT